MVKPGRGKAKTRANQLQLLDLRVLRFGLFQDRDVRIGVLPEGKEVLVRCTSLSHVPLHRVGPGQTELRQFPPGCQRPNAAMVQHGLEFSSGLLLAS